MTGWIVMVMVSMSRIWRPDMLGGGGVRTATEKNKGDEEKMIDGFRARPMNF